MKKTGKVLMKISALGLTLCLLLGLFPLSASAAAVYSAACVYDDSQGSLNAYNIEGRRSESFAAGEQVTLYANPRKGYEVDHVYCTLQSGGQTAVYGSLVFGETTEYEYKLKMPAENVTFHAVFKPAQKHRVTTKIYGGEGRVNIGGSEIETERDFMVYVYPDDGYMLSVIQYKRADGRMWHLEEPAHNVFSCTMPSMDIEIQAFFKKMEDSYTITVADSTGGSIGCGSSTALEGSRVTIYANPDYAYKLNSVTCITDKLLLIPIWENGYFEFYMPSANVTLTPEFVKRRTVEYYWFNDDGSVLDRKTGYEGRAKPVTDKIPTKQGDAAEYIFEGWELRGDYLYRKEYYPIFRVKGSANAAFSDMSCSQSEVYQGNSFIISGKLTDQSSGYMIENDTCTAELLYNGTIVYSKTCAVKKNSRSGTNVSCSFTVPDDAEPGEYTARVSYGSAEYTRTINVLEKEDTYISATAPKQAGVYETYNVEGTALDKDRNPMKNQSISVTNSVFPNSVFSVQTDGEGRFSYACAGRQEGTVTCTFTVGGWQYRCEPAVVTTYIKGDDHTVAVAESEHGSASASVPSAQNGDTVTLTAFPDEGYVHTGWEVVEGGVTIENDAFVMLTSDVEVKPVFELKHYTVTVDCGEFGDNIVAVEINHGARFFDALNDAGVFSALDDMETDDYLFRDIATKPLAEFADEEEYSEDAYQLINSTVTSDMTVYAGFYQKLRNVVLTVTPPKAGTVVEGDWEGQTTPPQLTLGENAHCYIYSPPVWETEEDIFEGTIQAGATYYTSCMLMPDFGYWLEESTNITVNGGAVTEMSGRMALYVKLSVRATGTPEVLLGDANLDGKVNIRDVTAIQRHLSELEPLSVQALALADTNGDGEIDIDDATLIQMYLAEFFIKFPAEA